MLAGATWGKKRIGVGEDQVRLQDVDTRRLSGLKYKLICHFKLVANMVGVTSGSL